MGAKEKCEILGIYGHPEASKITRIGLAKLLKDQQQLNILTNNGKGFHYSTDIGFTNEDPISEKSIEDKAIGQNGHFFEEKSAFNKKEPYFFDIRGEKVCFGFNGYLKNHKDLTKKIYEKGIGMHSSNQSMIFPHLIALSEKKLLEEKVIESCEDAKGPYSLLVMTKDNLIGFRSNQSDSALQLGQIKIDKKSYAYFIASKSIVFDDLDVNHTSEIKPGEMITIKKDTSGLPKYSKIHLNGKCAKPYGNCLKPNETLSSQLNLFS